MIRVKLPTNYFFISERAAGLPFLEALAQAQPAKWDYLNGKDVYMGVDEELEVSFKAPPPKAVAPLEAPPPEPPTKVSLQPFDTYNCPACGEVPMPLEEYEKQVSVAGPWTCPKCKESNGHPSTTDFDDDIPY